MNSAPLSIRKNFAYKSTLTLSSYIMAFITFPYVSRVLGVEHIGLVNFVDNTINYFLLFATMGMNLLGVREIAAVKEDPDNRNAVFSKLLGMNLMFTVATLLVYMAAVVTLSKLNLYKELFFIGTSKIIATAFLVEWFFTGIEDFRYITLRSLAIKLLYVIAVFVFVRTRDDYELYFIITTGTVVLNAVVNSIYVRKFVELRWKDILDTSYLKQNCILGIYAIMTSMYLTFNVMYLGLVSNNTQVGYYTTAFKVYMVILGLFSAFTNVMLPRMSALLAEGEQQRFQQLVDKSFRAICTFSMPIIACAMILSPQIIYILSGAGYEGAVTPMRIIMPAALFVGIAQVLAIQILTPMKRDKSLFAASVVGAAVSLMINISLVHKLQSIGSALVLLCSEIAVTTIYTIYVVRHKLFSIPFASIWKNALLTIPAATVCLLCTHYIVNPFISTFSAITAATVCWGVCKYIFTTVKQFV